PVIRPGVWALLQNLESPIYGSLLRRYRRPNTYKVRPGVKQAGVNEPALGQTAQHNESEGYA
ncbi:MAG: hypothetical protein QGH41_09015, partial [Roseibacillus sp.]|nr:hypothetical protein [Roseibacillus sp.]